MLAGIEGRKADVIRTPDGRAVPGNGLMGALHGVRNIRRSQIIQEQLDHVVVNVQKEDPSQPVDTTALSTNLHRCLGPSIQIDVRFVNDIDMEGRSKFRWVSSKLGM